MIRALGVLVAFVVVCGHASHAEAQIRTRAESPIHGAFEFKLGVATPELDSEFGGDGVYDAVFGDRTMMHFELEYDGYFWRDFGSLGGFFAVGHSAVRANSINDDGSRNGTDRTRLRVVPLRLGVVYRFDVLAERYRIPLAFTAKAGLDWYLWWATSSNGVADYVPADGGDRSVGKGGTTGWHAAFGIHFLLDVLAPQMAQSFDNNVGVNNTYLFAELMVAQVNDFGGAGSWDLSDTSAVFGLAFEF